MEEFSLTITSFSQNHIQALCDDEEDNEAWNLSAVYGYPEEHNKWRTWQLIKELGSQVIGKWVCFGDLNDILDPQEKMGGNARSQTQYAHGREVVAESNLLDLGFEGYPFTWSNGRQDKENIQCRLDRALGNEGFVNRFSPIKVSHLPRFKSDHAVILIHLEAPHQGGCRKRKKLFRFEESWTKESSCEDVIIRYW
jgi:hypothetical protein